MSVVPEAVVIVVPERPVIPVWPGPLAIGVYVLAEWLKDGVNHSVYVRSVVGNDNEYKGFYFYSPSSEETSGSGHSKS